MLIGWLWIFLFVSSCFCVMLVEINVFVILYIRKDLKVCLLNEIVFNDNLRIFMCFCDNGSLNLIILIVVWVKMLFKNEYLFDYFILFMYIIGLLVLFLKLYKDVEVNLGDLRLLIEFVVFW